MNLIEIAVVLVIGFCVGAALAIKASYSYMIKYYSLKHENNKLKNRLKTLYGSFSLIKNPGKAVSNN